MSDLYCDTNEMEKGGIVCYVGGLTEERNITTLVELSGQLLGDLYLAGPITENYLAELNAKYRSGSQSKWFYVGVLNRQEVRCLYEKSAIGVCVLKKTRNYYLSLPIKIFEYMEAGLPIIVSDFPLWREIVEDAQCGFCVDAENPAEIAEKINYLFANPTEAAMMGENGRKAVVEKYNWESEEKKLLQAYAELR